MAFLLELVPIIAEAVAIGGEATVAGGEVVAAGGEVVAAGGEAVTAGGEAVAAGGEATTTAVGTEATTATTAETGAAAGETGNTIASTASKVPVFDMTASGTTAGANAAHQAILQGAVAFAKWAAVETAKQAVFFAGMEAAEAAFHAIADSLSNSPEKNAIAAKVHKINDAASRLHSTTADWLSWSSSHYTDRDSFGTVKALGVVITRFEVFQHNLGSLGDWLNNKVVPSLLAFNKSKTADDLEVLRVALRDYCNQVKDQSDSIKANEQAMVVAGLQDHQPDVASALSNLS